MIYTIICKICKKEGELNRSPSQYKPVCCGEECAKKWRSQLMKIRNSNQFRWSDLNEAQKKDRIQKRFDEKTEKTNDCWLWKGNFDKDGYGQLLAGIKGNQFSERKAHRISWYLTYGEIPKGKMVCHTCHNRKCVNPFHLKLGFHKDNMQDRSKANRSAKGEKLPQSKLTTEQVIEIKKLLNMDIKNSRIAKDFHVSGSSISAIKKGRNWNWVVSNNGGTRE